MYTTYAKVIAYDSTITLTQPEIESIIKSVTSYLDTFCNQKLASLYSATPSDFYFDGSGTENIVFENALNGSLTLENSLDGTSFVSETNVLFYPLNSSFKTYMRKTYGRFSEGNGNYKVKGGILGMFTYDWTTPANHTLPDDITLVATKMVAETIKAGGIALGDNTKSGKISSETIGSYSVSYAQDTSNLSTSLNSVLNATNVMNNYKNSANIV